MFSPGASAALALTGVTRHFGRVKALDALSLDFAPGQLTTVVGPQGSGKSTLMRILAGVDRRFEGSLELDGAVINRVPVRRRGFGVLQQGDHLFGHMTLGDNVALPLRWRGVARAERHQLVQAALDLVQLGEAGHVLPAAATAEQAQRAMLARAAVCGPRVLLLDEPFAPANGVPPLGFIAILQRLHSVLGATTVLATRFGSLALPLSDRVVVLRDGSLDQCGTPEEIFGRPDNPHVAALFGETNRLAGMVAWVDADCLAVRLDCGPLVEAGPGHEGLRPGMRCLVLLRPEAIAVAAVSAAEMGEGALDATVLEAQFWGECYRLRLLIGSGAELVVRRPALAGLQGLVAGRAVSIAWQTHHALVFSAA